MKINIFYGIEGAKEAIGMVIIVDIFRAGSLAAYILNKNAKHIIPVATKEEAFLLQQRNPDYILIGEEEGITIEGFDYGNSPYEITHADLCDRIVVHRSTQGIQGIVNAKKADDIIFGSFPVLSAILKFIQTRKPKFVSIVSMDEKGSEDDVFANHLKQKLLGNNPDTKRIIQRLKKHKNSLRFLDSTYPQFPKGDLDLCLRVDIFNFIPLVEVKDNQQKIKKTKV